MIVICGKSGSGKDTIAKALLRLGLQRTITYTTRPRRKGEVDGETYHFVSDEKFQSLIDTDFIIETTEYKVATGETWRYGTPFSGLDENKFIIMNPDGVKAILHYPEYNPTIFFLYADDKVRLQRLEQRGDSVEEVHRRMIADEKDFANIKDYYDFIVPNNISDPNMVAEYIYYENKRNSSENI